MESRKFEIFKIVFGFVLTGVVGTIVSNVYRQLETKDADFKSFRARSAEVHDNVTDLAGRCLFATRVYLNTLKEIDSLASNKDEVQARYAVLQASWMDWNAAQARNTQAMHFFFSDKPVLQWNEFIKELASVNESCELLYLDYLNLVSSRSTTREKPSKELFVKMEKLWYLIYALSDSMQGEMFSADLKKKWQKERDENRD